MDVMIEFVQSLPTSHIVADFGCGEARLAQTVEQKVHSFDLVARNEYITACDMANVPLANGSVDVCIFCLSLMGSNFLDFVREANRVLRRDGILRVAEVTSRIDDMDAFCEAICGCGFELTDRVDTNKVFVDLQFRKSNAGSGKAKGKNKGKKQVAAAPADLAPVLKPCIYKRR